ncbi:MAG: HlyD family efflux transporter periplasmic adaptor subunit [Thiobacillaceae bacterium]
MQARVQQTPITPVMPQRQAAGQAVRVSLSSEHLLQLQAELLGRKRFREAATALAQQLAGSLKCDRASLGWREKNGIEVVAASYVAEVHARQETARLVAAAMEEATEQGIRLVHPEPDSNRPHIVLAHDELARRQGYALCTVPLAHEGRIIGALTMERRDGEFTATEAAHIERVAAMLAPTLALKYENGLSIWRRSSTSFKEKLHSLLQTGTPAHKPILIGIATAAVLLAGVLLIPMPYNVSAPAKLEGAVQRVLTAPADGYLQKVYARPGDRVKTGQVLAELADQDMLVEQRGLEAELAQHENALISAQAHSDRAEYSLNQGRADSARARLDLLQQQLQRSHLRAPFDGVIIKGDLSQSIGSPVERGAELITLAPASGYRVKIEAEETEVADLKTGQSGRLILAAMPSLTLPFHVERITPLASSEEGHHYFAVYATLEGKLPALRPGMQGFAKIEVDSRSMLFNWVRRASNWCRIKLWSWGA